MWPVALHTGMPFLYMKHKPTVQILLNHMLVMWVFWVKWANTPSSCLISWYKFFPRELFICQDISLWWNMEVQVSSWNVRLCHCVVFSTISKEHSNFIFKVKQPKTNWTVCHWQWRWHHPSKWWELLIQHHSVTPQKMWILSNTPLRNSSFTTWRFTTVSKND